MSDTNGGWFLVHPEEKGVRCVYGWSWTSYNDVSITSQLIRHGNDVHWFYNASAAMSYLVLCERDGVEVRHRDNPEIVQQYWDGDFWRIRTGGPQSTALVRGSERLDKDAVERRVEKLMRAFEAEVEDLEYHVTGESREQRLEIARRELAMRFATKLGMFV